MALVGACVGWTSAAVGHPCAVSRLLAGAAVSFSGDPAIKTPFLGNGNCVLLFWSCQG